MRYIVQSRTTGRFLAPDDHGQPDWVVSLKDAAGGVVDDVERAYQLIADYGDFDDMPQLVNLDTLGLE